MRALFATGSPPSYMRPPLLADDQVECGPDFSEVKRADGSLASLPTPLGEYDSVIGSDASYRREAARHGRLSGRCQLPKSPAQPSRL